MYLTLTSNPQNVDAYITEVGEKCPTEGIILGSKVIYVNGELVEGLGMKQIARHIGQGDIPLTLSMVKPEGLMEDERPDLKPETCIYSNGRTGKPGLKLA